MEYKKLVLGVLAILGQ